jgi:hypothetical protein
VDADHQGGEHQTGGIKPDPEKAAPELIRGGNGFSGSCFDNNLQRCGNNNKDNA